MHDDYKYSQSLRYPNNIMLLTLATAANFSDRVRPACLWRDPDNANMVGEVLSVSGYGLTDKDVGLTWPRILRTTNSMMVMADSDPLCQDQKVC